MDLIGQPLTRKAETLAKVLRLLESAQGPGTPHAVQDLGQYATRLDELARSPGKSGALTQALRDGIRLGERATKQLRRESVGGPLLRLGKLFIHNRGTADPETLASSLLKQLRQHEKALERLSRR